MYKHVYLFFLHLANLTPNITLVKSTEFYVYMLFPLDDSKETELVKSTLCLKVMFYL